MKQSSNREYTILELLIIVAVIGICVTIGVPAYNDYMVRDRISKMGQESVGPRDAISQFATAHGSFPANAMQAGVTPPTSPLIKSITVGNGTGVIILASDPAVVGATILLTYTPTLNAGSVTWSCAASGNSKFTPESCN